MQTSVKMKVAFFCKELSDHDPWQWLDTCQKLLHDIDYSAPAKLWENDNFYQIAAVLKDGRLIELSRWASGWGIKYESPVGMKARHESGLTPRAADDGDSLIVDDLPFFGWEPNEADLFVKAHRR